MDYKIKIKDVTFDQYCSHHFFEISKGMDVNDPINYKSFTLIMCGHCGERRKLWQDGTLEILKPRQL